ncbi:MAG: hypothetical protein IPJ65_38240 [Archangiaceae bacterium]|nr:hypothetical protein [Archangiaceae bacterium]
MNKRLSIILASLKEAQHMPLTRDNIYYIECLISVARTAVGEYLSEEDSQFIEDMFASTALKARVASL